MPEWTAAQQRVIQSKSQEIVCSAAAGSGKTAVMVERVIQMLKDGAEPEGFLIITFTTAAAAEMKERIRKRLLQDRKLPRIQNALDRIDLMQISTIHSFCQALIRNQFQLIEIDPNFQICDASMRQRLFHEAFTEACDHLQESGDPFYLLLRQRMDIKKAEEIVQLVHPFLMSLPEPFTWMNGKIRNIPERLDPAHPWYRTIREMAEEQLQMAEIHLSEMYRMLEDSFALDAYRDAWKADAEMFHVKQSRLEHPEEPAAPASFTRLKTPRGLTVQEFDWKEQYAAVRKKFKERINQADQLLLNDPERILPEWRNMKDTLTAVETMVYETQRIFQEKKKARGALDFSDLEQYAVQILSTPEGRDEALSVWRYIFVDECQDIAAVQNRIIDLLRGPDQDLFMVGDIKQSIYRFRLADPSLFQRRIEECREPGLASRECIFLQSNFRSRPEILETTNLVFRSIMKASVTEINYGREEMLIPGRSTEGSFPVQAVRIDKGEQDLTDLEATAEFLREEIGFLLQEDYPGENRKYQYRDCVILMPAVRTDGPILAKHLTDRGIPVFLDDAGDYYQLQEIQRIRNLLEWVEDPLQDLPLISVLQSPPFDFSEEELGLIRALSPDRETPFFEAFRKYAEGEDELAEKCRRVTEKHRRWQGMAGTLRVSELIWELYQETGIYYIVSADPGGDAKQANLRMLAQQAADGESRGILTLRQFLTYMKDQQSFGDQQSATLLGEQDNLVRIMTVHKSKGLQFPVVFCAGMDKSPVRTETREIMCHTELGLCTNYRDPEHRISRPTLATEIFAWRKDREEKAEKVRLLYVAMTRAQERLYLMTCQEANPVWSMPEGEARILSAKSYTDWWMPALLQDTRQNLSTGYSQGAKPYEIRDFACNKQEAVEKEEDFHSLSSWLESLLSAPVVDEMWKTPEREDSSPTLKKRSVTALIKSARSRLEEDLEEETAEKKRMPDQLARRMERTEMEELPAFMREKGAYSPAWRGTLTHRILSLISLEDMRGGKTPEEALRELKDRMIRENMASEAELAQISDQQIVSFWKSETGRRILGADEVRREWNFNLLIHREQDMILQGVADCAFREGDEWVILDYKTDRGKTAEELAEEYRPQLLWYARAIGELTGQRVKETALYSLSLDRAIPV